MNKWTLLLIMHVKEEGGTARHGSSKRRCVYIGGAAASVDYNYF
jgi:hypothetical protein